MFDDIWCKVPLPDGWDGKSFQTKDLDCELAKYGITEDGRLVRLEFDLEPDGPPGPHPFLRGITDWQAHKRVNERWIDVPHHGDIYFYGYEGDANDERPIGDRWHEYRARFTEGRLSSLIVARRGDGAA